MQHLLQNATRLLKIIQKKDFFTGGEGEGTPSLRIATSGCLGKFEDHC